MDDGRSPDGAIVSNPVAGRVGDAYRTMLADVAAAPELMGTAPLTSLWPLAGSGYRPGGLLVVGQAVNGWIPEWSVDDLSTREGEARVLDDVSGVCMDRHDPMSWIATNRVRRSPFWRVVRGVTERWTDDGDSPWHARVAWSNLYLIAPAAGGNPTEDQCIAQRAGAAGVLRATIEAIDPGLVLFLVGPYWRAYREHLSLSGLTTAARPLYEHGVVAGRRYVVGWHPGGAQRRGWPAARYVEQIMAVSGRAPAG